MAQTIRPIAIIRLVLEASVCTDECMERSQMRFTGLPRKSGPFLSCGSAKAAVYGQSIKLKQMRRQYGNQ
jgi:hypothetical protein